MAAFTWLATWKIVIRALFYFSCSFSARLRLDFAYCWWEISSTFLYYGVFFLDLFRRPLIMRERLACTKWMGYLAWKLRCVALGLNSIFHRWGMISSLGSDELLKDMGGDIWGQYEHGICDFFWGVYFRMKDWEYGGGNYTISRGFLFSAMAGAF